MKKAISVFKIIFFLPLIILLLIENAIEIMLGIDGIAWFQRMKARSYRDDGAMRSAHYTDRVAWAYRLLDWWDGYKRTKRE